MNHYFDLNLKATSPSSFTAVASTSRIDRDGEILDPHCFLPLAPRIPCLLYHDQKMVAGSGVPSYDDHGRLLIEGSFANTGTGREARELVVGGHISSVSVGYAAAQYEIDKKDGLRHLRRGELCEVSFVPVPSNSDARILAARNYDGSRNVRAVLARAKAALALADARQLLADTDKPKRSPQTIVAEAERLLQETTPMRNPLRSTPTEGTLVKRWPVTDTPVMPRLPLLSLGVQQGFREFYDRGKGLRREPVEYELFVEWRKGGYSLARQWHRYRDAPDNLVYQGGTEPNQTIVETFTVSRSAAREISQRNDPNFDPDRKSTVKVAAPIAW